GVALHQQADAPGLAREPLDERRRQVVDVARGRRLDERVQRVERLLERAEIRAPPQLVVAAWQRQRAERGDRGATALERPCALARGLRARERRLGPRLRQRGDRPRGDRAHPTEPSICSWIRRFISTAYSIGSSFTTGSMKPETIIAAASSA